MMSRKKFQWSGHEFEEVIENGERSIVLRLANPDQEFTARSEPLLREEAASRLLAHEAVQGRLREMRVAPASDFQA